MTPARRPVALLAVGGLFAAFTLAWGSYSAVSLMAYDSTYTDVRFPAASVRHLVIRTSGSITVDAAPSGSDQIALTRRVVRGLRAPSYSETIDGDTLTIRSSCPAFADFHCTVNYSIHVPAATTVEAETSGSNLHVHDVDGDLDLDTSGGGIELARVSGALTLRSSGGGIRAVEVASGDVDASSSGGSIRFSFSVPPDAVRVSSSGGGVSVEVPHDETSYRADVSSSGGSRQADVKTDPESSHVIVIRSSGGSARLRYHTG